MAELLGSVSRIREGVFERGAWTASRDVFRPRRVQVRGSRSSQRRGTERRDRPGRDAALADARSAHGGSEAGAGRQAPAVRGRLVTAVFDVRHYDSIGSTNDAARRSRRKVRRTAPWCMPMNRRPGGSACHGAGSAHTATCTCRCCSGSMSCWFGGHGGCAAAEVHPFDVEMAARRTGPGREALRHPAGASRADQHHRDRAGCAACPRLRRIQDHLDRGQRRDRFGGRCPQHPARPAWSPPRRLAAGRFRADPRSLAGACPSERCDTAGDSVGPEDQRGFAGLDADGALLLYTKRGRQRIISGDVAVG